MTYKSLRKREKEEILNGIAMALAAINALISKVNPTSDVFDSARWTQKYLTKLAEEVERC